MIEQALLHHLQRLDEIPEEVVIPPRLVITSVSGGGLLEQLESQVQFRYDRRISSETSK